MTSYTLSAFLGSLVALRWAPGATWLGRAGNVSAGFAVAVFLTPGLAEWAGVTSPRALSALSFAGGMFGLSLTHAAVEAIRVAPFGAILTSWLSRK